jgi:hypothetical protein
VSNEHKLPRFLLALRASLDEALAAREWRRGRRWLRNSSVPTLYVLGSVLIPWLVVPGVYASVGGWSGQTVLQSQPRWLFMTLAITLVGGAMATAFGRVSQIWNTERVQQTLEGWFLSGQQPGPVVLTASVTGAALALAVSLPGALLLLVIAVVLRVPAFHVPLTLLLLVVGAALAAAAASAAFLTGAVGPAAGDSAAASGDPEDSSPPSPSQLPAPSLLAAACAVIALTLWLRREAVAGGWQRPWEEHP